MGSPDGTIFILPSHFCFFCVHGRSFYFAYLLLLILVIVLVITIEKGNFSGPAPLIISKPICPHCCLQVCTHYTLSPTDIRPSPIPPSSFILLFYVPPCSLLDGGGSPHLLLVISHLTYDGRDRQV